MQPGSSESFKNVQFEVRFDQRDWAKITILPEEAALEEQENEKDNSKEDDEKEKAEHPNETPQEKLIRKKKE